MIRDHRPKDCSDARICFPHCHAIFRERKTNCPNDGSILIEVPVVNDLSHQVLNKKYKLEESLGQGGFGSVYAATHLVLGKKVAVKVLRSEFRSDSTMVARFFNEARVVTKLTNPHTIATFDLDQTEEGLLFMVMDFVTGRTLRKLAKEEGTPPGRLPWERALRLLVQVCDSLEEAHSHGVVHRDLKPDNIMVSNRGGEEDFVTVLDFGIAKVIEGADAQQLTAQGSLIGSPAYMSPEQILGRDLDPRSDLYSLGSVAYHVLTGSLPVNAKQTAAMLQEKVLSKPAPLRKKAPDLELPLELEHLVMRLLEVKPDHRPDTAAMVKHAFLEFLGQTAQSTSIPDIGEGPTLAGDVRSPGTQAYAESAGSSPPPTGTHTTSERTEALEEDDTAYLETLQHPSPGASQKPETTEERQQQTRQTALYEEQTDAALETEATLQRPASEGVVQPKKEPPKWLAIAVTVAVLAIAGIALAVWAPWSEEEPEKRAAVAAVPPPPTSGKRPR